MSTDLERKKEELNTLVRKIQAVSDLTKDQIAVKIGYDPKYLSKFGPNSDKPPGQAVIDKLAELESRLTKGRESEPRQEYIIRWRGAEMTYAAGREAEATRALADLIERTATERG